MGSFSPRGFGSALSYSRFFKWYIIDGLPPITVTNHQSPIWHLRFIGVLGPPQGKAAEVSSGLGRVQGTKNQTIAG
jgi:hypothetical protein